MLPKESFPKKDLLALLHFLFFEDSLLGVLLTKSLKSWNVAFLKFSILILSDIHQEGELHPCMATTAQAASNPDITNQLTCIGEQQVQHCRGRCKGGLLIGLSIT